MRKTFELTSGQVSEKAFNVSQGSEFRFEQDENGVIFEKDFGKIGNIDDLEEFLEEFAE